MTSLTRLGNSFFRRDVLEVAPDLLGKSLVRKFPDGTVSRFIISETEAYRGTEDRACHASKGRTARTEVMFQDGGLIYVYFVYGMYWMLNFVTGNEGDASAVLIRGLDETFGPGKVGKMLQIDRTFYGENLTLSERIWIENSNCGKIIYNSLPRVGIPYAGEPWVSVPWRFRLLME
jgi:DNA-3-methyladenine glycosylase